MKFKRDYKIEVTADNNDLVFWRLSKKGEYVSPNEEDKEVVAEMLRDALGKIGKSLEEYRQRKREENIPEYRILQEIQVTPANIKELHQMLLDGIIERLTYDAFSHPSIRVWLKGMDTFINTDDWIILDTECRVMGITNNWHNVLTKLGKIKIIKE